MNRRHARTTVAGRHHVFTTPLIAAMAAVALAAAAADDALQAAPPASGLSPAASHLTLSDIIDDLLDAMADEAEDETAMAGAELELETLKLFIEFNETDEDVGVQCVLGGEPYKSLKVFAPDGKRILDLRPRRSLRRQGMSDFFFESAEPALDEVSMEDFLDRFPAGIYEFETRTLENDEQDGDATFTHVIPAGPVITSPGEGDVVDPDALVITWDPVTMTTAFNPPQVPVTIVGYQVIVTREDPLRVYSVDVGPGTTSVSVAPEFLDAETEYELEIIAIEESDNQTISIVFFETE